MLNWIGYQLVMHFDAAINPDTAFGRWCLVRAGAWAYPNQTISSNHRGGENG